MSMIFRYSPSKTWLKGNLHVHSTRSDGALSPDQVCALYARAGYDFIALTDHRRAGDAGDGLDDSLLVLNGLELDGRDSNGAYHHIVIVGETQTVEEAVGAYARSDWNVPLQPLMERLDPDTSFRIWAHPHWSMNRLQDGFAFDFDALEVFNSSSQEEVGRGYGMAHWDYLLQQRPNMFGVAADDAHHTERLPCWGGGWIRVNVRDAEQKAVLQALKRGEFYASNGPEFQSFAYDGQTVTVKTSLVRIIRLITPGLYGDLRVAADRSSGLTRAVFDLQDAQHPVRIEIEDFQGRIAWSNPLFVSHDPD